MTNPLVTAREKIRAAMDSPGPVNVQLTEDERVAVIRAYRANAVETVTDPDAAEALIAKLAADDPEEESS